MLRTFEKKIEVIVPNVHFSGLDDYFKL